MHPNEAVEDSLRESGATWRRVAPGEWGLTVSAGGADLHVGLALRGGMLAAQAEEFGEIVERAPTNDYALFCLGRSLQLMGRHAEARRPLALAATLRPDRSDYRQYRDQSRRRAA